MTDLPRPIAARYIGQSVPRQEDRRLLTGHGCYVGDVRRPEQMLAAFVRSEVAAGRIQSVDISAAMALAGVVAVLTGDDLNQDAGEMYWATTGPEMPMAGPLAPGRVSYVGDPIAVVVASSRYIAEDAVDLVHVDYEIETPVVDYRRARERGAMRAGALKPTAQPGRAVDNVPKQDLTS
jgi:carbon-monoxide dehydrogenase large subunit